MSHMKFDEKELQVVSKVKDFFGNDIPVYNFPVTMRESAVSTFWKKDPWWIMTDIEQNTFTPSVIPDNGARGFVFEGQPYPREKFGGKDMFGIEWEYIDVAGGSMVKPGNPLLEDATEWKEKVVFPDIDSWDWAGSAEMNREYLSNGKCNVLTFLNGCWFERLISFLDFENAAVAVIDDDQIPAVKELVHELTSLYIRLVDKCLEHYDLDGFSIHDDWGSQKSPFFSEDVARDIFLPEMKRFVSYIHEKGKFVDLHSCGHIEDRCNIFVEAGFDSWTPMPMNNTQKLYEEYGDKIILGIVYDKPFDPATATEEEQRAAARDFVEKYTKPGKPAMYSIFYNPPGMLTDAFREELYKASRIRYSNAKIPFSEEELNVLGEHINTTMSFGGPVLKYNTPITPRENVNACLRRDGSAMWIPTFTDFLSVESRVNRDHIARAEVMDLGPLYPEEEKGGPDLFGIQWVYIPVAGGSMVKPGDPVLDDVNDWPEIIHFPDVDAMDWEACGTLNAPLNQTERAYHITFQNGLFERLISFMDFEGAAIAIIDDEQKDAIHALFSRLCDMYEAMITKYMQYLTIDGVMFHDDWGSQRAPFFSPAVCREMLVPYIKRLADFCHARGLWFEQHSCGRNELLVPCMIEAGVDIWFPQDMNDVDKLRAEYGDKIMLGVYPPVTTPEMTDEEIDRLAREFAEKYAPDMGTRPVVLVNFMCDPRFVPAVYKYSRIILADQ